MRALTDAHGLPGAALFHKKPLDSSRLGYAVADDVAAAIADVTGSPLVTCVLNTIDDALDRSDPGGTDWGADAVKHLAPLLDRARHAGTGRRAHRRPRAHRRAPPGHAAPVRRHLQRPVPRGDRARGRRGGAGHRPRGCCCTTARAVLAVDEHLRYGPLKAGYHGGAAPAEAVVPVAVLVPGAVPEDVGLRLAPPQEPSLVDRPGRSRCTPLPLLPTAMPDAAPGP